MTATALDELDEFVNPECKKAYLDLHQMREAFANAMIDLSSDEESPTILFLDFSFVYPLVTPRGDISPTPRRAKQDYAALHFLKNFSKYRNVSKLIPVYSPFLLLELFDQIKHRKDFYNSVVQASNPREAIRALKTALPHIPSNPSDLEKSLRQIVSQAGSPQLSDRLRIFVKMIQDGTLRSIHEFIPIDRFIPILEENQDLIKELYPNIDQFRRDSRSNDHADKEFHKIVDVLVIAFVKGARKYSNHRIVFVGQDRLRRAFGHRIDELSRDILTPYIIIKSLSEVASDRILVDEALITIRHRLKTIARMMEDWYEVRRSRKIALPIVKSLFEQDQNLKNFMYGEFKMSTEKEYDELIGKIADNLPGIQSMFSRSFSDATNAETMLKELAETVINKDFEQILKLHPNKKLSELLGELRPS